MGDNTFYTLICSIGRGIRPGQHAGSIENIKPFVLHCAHVETLDRNDHEDIQVVFSAIYCLVPFHGVLQRHHGVVDLVDVVCLGKNPERNFTAAHGHKFIFNVLQVAGDQGKQVSRFHKWILPGHPVPLAIFTTINVVAV